MHWFAFRSVRARLMVPIAIMLVAAAAVLLDAALTRRGREADLLRSDAQQRSRLVGDLHARAVREARHVLAAVAAVSGPLADDALAPVLETVSRDQHLIVGVADGEGRIVRANSRPAAATLARLPLVSARARLAGGIVVDAYAIDPAARTATVLLAQPVSASVDRIAFAEIDVARIIDAHARRLAPPAGGGALIDASGRLVARGADGDDVIVRAIADDASIRRAISSAPEGVVHVRSPGTAPRLVAYALVPETEAAPLYAMVHVPDEVGTAGVPLIRSVGVLAAAGLVAIGLTWMAGRRIASDADALATTIERFDADDAGRRGAGARAPVAPEFARLAGAIDDMACAAARHHDLAQRHEALAGREHRLRAVIEAAVGHVVLFDADGTVLYASPSSARMGAYGVDEVVGRRRFDAVHPDDRPMLRTRFEELSRTPGGAFRATFRLETRPGCWRWIECEIANRLHEPRVHVIVGRYRDVTELHDAEDERLRAQTELEVRVRERTAALTQANQSLHKLSRAIEQTADSVFVTNRDGVIEYVNPAFVEMTGFTPEEAIGSTPRLVSSGVHDRKYYAALWETILAGKVFRAVVTNKRKDGRVFHEDQSITPIRDAAGVVTHFVSTGRDITERKRTEEALRRLNTALEEESARIAAVLHDEAGQFLSSAHITLADVARDLSSDLRERVQQVRHHLDCAEQQLRRVSHELHPRILDDLGFTEAVQFLAAGFGRRNGILVDVDVSGGASCPRPVAAVFYRLVQEGLTNIAKHASATRVSILIAREGASMVCSIRDDGVGFDVDRAIEERRGFSLGLTLMRDRLEAVGGTLTIQSEPERGTALRAIVPVED